MSKQKHWQDLTSSQKIVVILLGFLQFVLLIAALRDIRRRPAEQINGSKRLWTLAAFVNFVGPLAYFIFGRK
ncbi:MAG: hypothetical protein BroJett011_02080 [Chloroflexota bacterium]|nr:MAG: hypothetical protein BroJett011_02080 [Chloroflexota bacterium]